MAPMGATWLIYVVVGIVEEHVTSQVLLFLLMKLSMEFPQVINTQTTQWTMVSISIEQSNVISRINCLWKVKQLLI